MESFRSWLSETTQRVFYHGTRTEYEKPKPDAFGVFWLAADPKTAEDYIDDRYYLKDAPRILLTVVLKPNANVIDLSDLGNPVVRELKDAVSESRATKFAPISDEDWVKWADFGIIEGYGWVVGFLKSKRVDGVIVSDRVNVTDHMSVALINLRAIASVSSQRLPDKEYRSLSDYNKP